MARHVAFVQHFVWEETILNKKKIKTDIGEIGDDDADQVPSFTIVTNGGLL